MSNSRVSICGGYRAGLAGLAAALSIQNTVTAIDKFGKACKKNRVLGLTHDFISIDECHLTSPVKEQITYGPQKRGKKGKVKRW